MAHAQKPEFRLSAKRTSPLNRRGRQFSRLLAAEVCSSAVVMLDTPCSEVVCRVLATHSIRQFPLHFPSRASPCAITFQLDSTKGFCLTQCDWNWLRVSIIQPLGTYRSTVSTGRSTQRSGVHRVHFLYFVT